MKLEVCGDMEKEEGIAEYYKEQVQKHNLTFNHYVKTQHYLNINLALEKTVTYDKPDYHIAEPVLINGYDGFGGVHDNLYWNPAQGFLLFTLNNKLIMEYTKTRSQTIHYSSAVRLSCMAVSADGKFVAVGEGELNNKEKNGFEGCNIITYSLELAAGRKGKKSKDAVTTNTLKQEKVITGHSDSVQSMCYTHDAKLLISVGGIDNSTVYIFNRAEGQLLEIIPLHNSIVNKVVAYPGKCDFFDSDVQRGDCSQFVTIGNNGHL